MTAKILKGAEVIETMNADLFSQSEALRADGINPTLAIVRVGERGDDISYERGATKRAEKVGVDVKNVLLSEDVTEDELIKVIKDINADDSVHGVLMFRPLPSHIDEDVVRNMLEPSKDIDGITDLSLAGVFAGIDTGYAPCTAQACMEILAHYGYDLQGKSAVVVGRSLVIGKPVAMMLLGKNATVTMCHSRSQDLPDIVSAADIVIACVGRANMVNADYLSEGQVVIDVGINVTEAGSLAGDVDFQAAEQIVEAITPVPGGVGTVTTSVLMKHVIDAASKR